ncbi:MAG TPA: MFS transporter [Solirubrobacterales bacterium]
MARRRSRKERRKGSSRPPSPASAGCTYVASFAISLGPIFWLLNVEIYPLSVRSKAAGIGKMANWTFNFIVSLTFLLLIQAYFQARVKS